MSEIQKEMLWLALSSINRATAVSDRQFILRRKVTKKHYDFVDYVALSYCLVALLSTIAFATVSAVSCYEIVLEVHWPLKSCIAFEKQQASIDGNQFSSDWSEFNNYWSGLKFRLLAQQDYTTNYFPFFNKNFIPANIELEQKRNRKIGEVKLKKLLTYVSYINWSLHLSCEIASISNVKCFFLKHTVLSTMRPSS